MIYKLIRLFITLAIIGLSFSYQVGDEVNMIDQNKVFEICYGDNLDLNGDGEIKLADFNGDLNGGHYYVMLIDMSATWCGPCYSLIPYFDIVALFIATFSSCMNIQSSKVIFISLPLTGTNNTYSNLKAGPYE